METFRSSLADTAQEYREMNWCIVSEFLESYEAKQLYREVCKHEINQAKSNSVDASMFALFRVLAMAITRGLE